MTERDRETDDGRGITDLDRERFALLAEDDGAARDVEAIADDAFAHGLLRTALRDDDDADRRRLDRTLAALRSEAAPERGRPAVARTTRARTTPGPSAAAPPRRRRLAALPAGLALVVVACLVIFGDALVPERVATAADVVRATVDASATLGDRRYEVRVEHDDSGRFDVIGTLDLRGDDHALMRIRTPRGDEVVVGRIGDRWWSIAPDGGVVEHDASMRWPRWIESDDSILLLEPIDAMLTRLRGSHELAFDADAASDDGTTRRIVATRRARSGPEPERVRILIDSDSLLVRELSLAWRRPPHRPDRPPSDARPGRRRGAGNTDDAGPPRGPGGRQRGRALDADPPHDGDRTAPPRRPRRGPDGLRRPPLPGGLAPPPGERAGDRADRPPRRPFGPRRFGPPRDPHLRLAPPDFGDPAQPPPPRRVRLVLAEDATFDVDWFEPDVHAR